MQRSVDGNWGRRNLAMWNGHYLSICHGVQSIFWGVQDVKTGLLILTSLAKYESRMNRLELAHQCLMV